MDFTQRFNDLLDEFTDRDGRRFTASKLSRIIDNGIAQGKNIEPVSPRYMTRLINGEMQNPSYQIIVSLAYALDIEPGDFFEQSDDSNDRMRAIVQEVLGRDAHISDDAVEVMRGMIALMAQKNG